MSSDLQDYLGKALADMELRLVREIHAVRDAIPSDARVRELARQAISDDHIREVSRDEMGLVNRATWTGRSAMAAIGMFCISVSTFILTITHHKL